MRKKKAALLSLLTALCLLLSACGETAEQPEEQKPEEENYIQTGQRVEGKAAADRLFSVCWDPEKDMNPIKAASSTNMLFSSLMYDSVFTLDEHFEPSSELVTSYNSPDNTWWVFNVDTSIPFTDGSTLTAQDIVYSIQRAQQSPTYSNRLSVIYGISAMGSDCFAITTAYPDSQLPKMLNIPVIKYGSYGDAVPAGTGAYRLSEEGDRLVLFEENRHASEMPVDTVYLKSFTDAAEKISAFETGVLDIVTNDPTGMYNLGYGSSNEVRYYNTTNMHYLGFNMRSPYFSSSVSRYAMNFAVDKDRVAELMDGCAAVTDLPLPTDSPLYDAEYASRFDFDLDKCFRVLSNGVVGDHDQDGVLEFLVTGIVVEINIDFIVNNESTAKVCAAREIAENLNSIGITTTLRELEWRDYMEALEKGEYDMYYGEIKLTPDWNLAYLFEEKSSTNYARCFDTGYSELYHDYLAAGDLDRGAKFSEACRYLMENGGLVPICFEKRQVLTHRGVVTGIKASQYDLFNNFREWTIDLK